MKMIRGQNWGAIAVPGLVSVDRGQLSNPANDLIRLDEVRPASVPHPWAPAIAFSHQVRVAAESDGGRLSPIASTAFELFQLYLKGLVCGELKIHREPWPVNETSFARQLRNSARDQRTRSSGLAYLKRRAVGGGEEEAVAILDAEILFFPDALFTNWPPPIHVPPGDPAPPPLSEKEEALRDRIESAFEADDGYWQLYGATLARLLSAFGSGPNLWPQGRAAHGSALATFGVGIPSSAYPAWRAACERALTDLVQRMGLAAPTTWRVTGRTHPSEPVELALVTGQPAVDFQFDVAEIPAYDIFIDSVAQNARADWPVKGEHRALVRDCRFEAKAQYYSVEFSSGWTRTIPLPGIAPGTADLKPELLIWPDFDWAPWKHYEVFYEPAEGGSLPRSSFPVRFHGSDGHSHSEDADGEVAVTVLGWRPEFVELLRIDDDKETHSMGLFAVPAPSSQVSPNVNNAVTMALDFGTSTTRMSRLDPNTGEKVDIDFGASWQAVMGVAPGALSDHLAKLKHAVAASVLDAESIETPSQLIANRLPFEKSLSEPRDGATAIPNLRAVGAEQMVKFINNDRLLSGFKWLDGSFWPGKTTGTARTDQIRLGGIRFVRQVLIASAADLVKRGSAKIILRVGYPQAFSPEQLTHHRSIISQAAIEASSATGVEIAPDQLVSEAFASVWPELLSERSEAADYILAVDVGGGTTDYAVSEANVHGRSALEIQASLDASSLRLAGNAVLSGVAGVLWKDANFTRTLRLADAARRLRESSRGDLFTALCDACVLEDAERTRLNKDEVERRLSFIVWHAFLAMGYFGALMVAARLLRSAGARAERPTVVRVLAVGNGWSLAGLHPECYSSWRLTEASRAAEEKELAVRVFEAAWKGLRGAQVAPDPGDPLNELESQRRLPEVRFDVVRIPGKKETAHGLLEAIGSPFDATETALSTTEPLGVLLDGYSPLDRLPIRLPKKDSMLQRIKGAWGLPHDLQRIFGEEKGVASVLMRIANNQAMRAEKVAGNREKLDPGPYLIASPLRGLLEKNLIEILRRKS